MTDDTVHPRVAAGDPFIVGDAHRRRDDERPHCCLEGRVYLGVETEEGTEIVVVPCKRCKEKEE